MQEFLVSFKAAGLGTLEIFFLGFCGFFVLRQGILAECCLKTISTLIINVTLPCLIFVSVVSRFTAAEYPGWWMYPLAAVVLIGGSAVIGFIISRFDAGLREKREFISLMAFHNVSFLPLPLIAAMFPAQEAERYFVYVFLFLLGFIPLMASAAVLLVAGGSASRIRYKDALSPPFFAIVISLALAVFGFGRYAPATIMNPLRMLGSCTIPLSMIVLGGVVFINFRNKVHIRMRTIFEAAGAKLVLLPLIIFVIIRVLNIGKDMGLLLLIQAAMPPSSSLVAMAENYDGNAEFIGQATFFMYTASLVTIPLCLGLYMYLY